MPSELLCFNMRYVIRKQIAILSLFCIVLLSYFSLNNNSYSRPPVICCSVRKKDVENRSSINYTAGAKYWRGVSASIDGMMGGFIDLSQTDIDQSNEFLKFISSKVTLEKRFLMRAFEIGARASARILKRRTRNLLIVIVKFETKMGSDRALDCGSGIGRVTKAVLLKHFDTVDMVDETSEFIDASSDYLGQLNQRVGEKFCCGLQDFTPKNSHYDMIWVQWVAAQLTDDNLVDFLNRCQHGLTANGVIVLKENIAESSLDTGDFDSRDNSVARSRPLLFKLISNANLQVIRERKQTNWPAKLYQVRMFALTNQ